MKNIEVLNLVNTSNDNLFDIDCMFMYKLIESLSIDDATLVYDYKNKLKISAYYLYNVSNSIFGRDDSYKLSLFLDNNLIGYCTYNGNDNFTFFNFINESVINSVKNHVLSLITIESDFYDFYNDFDDVSMLGVKVFNTNQLKNTVVYENTLCCMCNIIDDCYLNIKFNNNIIKVNIDDILYP